ncbi:MAG: GTPase HflX [Bdellovibrionia bacterium]
MLESTESLLPIFHEKGEPLVVCVGWDPHSLDELCQLLTTLGVNPSTQIHVHSKTIHPATYVGKGKIEEVKKTVEETQAKAVIFDVELSPNQLRNLEKELKIPLLDRPGVILEIFSKHARTKESKTQVALARLQYLLPRLTHFWNHFERQRGGGTASRGMGEKQIEVDRRLVKQRITVLRSRLKDIEQERKVQRAGRKNVLKVALVGYTNAGKSTLLNALTQSSVRAENKLFATLDASIRSLDPNCHPPVVAIDTVGFISNLPHSLVASFRSTLEEVQEADFLVHVVDASHPQAFEQFQVTEKVLEELQLEMKPRITVLNKVDRVPEGASRNRLKVIAPGAQAISALNPKDVKKLRELILNQFKKDLETWEVLIPYSESKLEAQIHALGCVEVSRHLEKGTFYRLKIEGTQAKKLGLKRFCP